MQDGDTNQAMRGYIQRVLDVTGWSPTELARRSGLAPTTLTRPLNDPSFPFRLSLRTLEKLYAATGMAPPSLMEPATSQEPGFDTESREAALAVREDLPLAGMVRGAQGAARQSLHDIAGPRVERPWFLWQSREGYAVDVTGESMVPAFEPGHRLYVDPARRPRPGDDVVAVLSDGQSVIKRLKSLSRTHVELAQFNPAMTQTHAPFDIQSLHVVVGALRVRV
jgi:phage repressor protein C with HTH and peptisase S24 domain